jgi:hypothetical protein
MRKPLYAEVPRWRVAQSLPRSSITNSARDPLSFVEFPPPQDDDQATIPIAVVAIAGALNPDGFKQGK